VDPFAAVVGQYVKRGVPVAVVIEPDSLPNVATNSDDPHCGNSATQTAYTEGISYAAKTLHAAGAYLYLDAAHGGWLGWSDNAKKFATMLQGMGIAEFLRGFASNVANYQSLGVACPSEAFVDQQGTPRQLATWCQSHSSEPCCADPCGLLPQYNNGNNELNYVQTMTKALQQVLGADFAPKWLIDTGRNGVADMRSDCSNWCNVRGAGAGHAPTTNSSLPHMLDALFWLKTPGESDGCTQTLPNGDTCPRFDTMCASSDSIGSDASEPHAPEAGAWFDYQIKQLADNAALGGPPVPGPTPTPPRPPPPSPSGCPGGSLPACMALCPTDQYAQCAQACAQQCVSAGTSSPSLAAAAHARTRRSPKPFGTCEPRGAACPVGYSCEPSQLCMPTESHRVAARHGSAFHTAYEHALQRVRAQ